MKYKRLFTLIVSMLLLWVSITADAEFTVRTIYFQPTDAPNKTVEIRKMMGDVRDYFAKEMHRNGFGRKTFRIETENNEIAVHTIKAKHPAAHYKAPAKTYDAIKSEIPNRFKNLNNIHIIFVGGLQRVNQNIFGIGVSFFGNQIGGYAVIPANNMIFRVVVHEVAHTFGVQHNLDPTTDFVMGLDSGHEGFAEYELRWLDKSHYFNALHPNINFVPEVTKLHPIRVIDIPKHIIEIKADVESPNGIHQAEMARTGDIGILDTHFLHANPKETVVFQFNVKLLRGETRAWLRVLDTHGNFWMERVDLEIPPAAFLEPEPEKPTPLKPQPLKPAKPEPIKPDDAKSETAEPEKETPRNIRVNHKTVLLWVKLKQ